MNFCAITIRLILILGGELSATSPATQPSSATQPSPALSTATTIDEIIKTIKPAAQDHIIQSVLFNRIGRQIFAVWYCPFSGRGDCYLYAYYYDYEKTEWVRFIDRLVNTRGDLSPEMPSGEEITFRAGDGTIAVRESVSAFPSKLQ